MDAIWSHLFAQKKTEIEKNLEILAKTVIFEGLDKARLKRMMRIFHERHYKTGEIVFSSGEPGVGMYIVCEGEVSVHAINPEERDAHPEGLEVARLKPGEIFGDIALFGAHQRSATVIAQAPTRLLGVVRPEFLTFLKQEPALGCEILTRLLFLAGQRLEYTNNQLLQTREALQTLQRQRGLPPAAPSYTDLPESVTLSLPTFNKDERPSTLSHPTITEQIDTAQNAAQADATQSTDEDETHESAEAETPHDDKAASKSEEGGENTEERDENTEERDENTEETGESSQEKGESSKEAAESDEDSEKNAQEGEEKTSKHGDKSKSKKKNRDKGKRK